MPTATRSQFTRQLALVTLSALLLAGEPGAAQAAEVVTNLTGRVTAINESNSSGITTDLAALGFTVGTAVTIAYTIDDTAVANPNTQASTIYFDSIVSLVITGGQYEFRFDRGPSPNGDSRVSAGDNRIGVGAPSDFYIVQADGDDTGDTLSPNSPAIPVVGTVSLTDLSAQAISDERVIQSADAFPTLVSFATIVGSAGSIVINFDEPGGGPGGGDTSRCVSGQLAAAAKFASSFMKCGAKGIAQPLSKDPDGVKVNARITKAQRRYEAKFAKSATSAEKRGDGCVLPASAAPATSEALLTDLTVLAIGAVADMSREERSERAFLAKVLKTLGSQLSKELGAFAKDARKSNATKLQRLLTASRAKTVKAIDKAVARAQKRGIQTGDIAGAGAADAVRLVVLDHVNAVNGASRPD